MDEKELLITIKERLYEIGCNYEDLTSSQIKQINKIELELSNRLLNQQASLKTLKENKINIASVSGAIDITRKTIYNNTVLKDYIEYVGGIYDSNYPTSEIPKYKDKLKELNEIIDKMVRRDINVEKLKKEIEELRKEVISYKDQVEGLTEDNIDISNKLHSYEKKQRTKSTLNIVK